MIGLVVGAVVAGGAAFAAIPDAGTGVYHGCVNKETGTLQVIDPSTGAKCFRGENPITWNQTGPQGPAGTPGANGTNGASVVNAVEPPGPNCVYGGSRFTVGANPATFACNGVGSPPAGAPVFTAVAGGTSFTVTFAAAVNIPVAGNFLLNGGPLGGAPVVQQTAATTFLVYGIAVLKPGDVIAINSASPPTAASGGAPVPVASFSVSANAAPLVVGTQFFIGGHAITVQFSKPVSLNGGVTCAGSCGALALANTSQDATTYEWTTAGVIGASDVLTITTAVTDLAVPPVPLPASVALTSTPSAVGPTITTAYLTVLSPTTYAVTAIMSRPIVPTAAPTAFTNWSASSGASVVEVVTNNNASPTYVTVVFYAATPAQAIVRGTTTLKFTNSAAVQDFAGNGLAPTTIVTS